MITLCGYYVAASIDLTVATGRLIAVVGPVGAGKTSLINCIMGEMVKLRGRVAMKVSQPLINTTE